MTRRARLTTAAAAVAFAALSIASPASSRAEHSYPKTSCSFISYSGIPDATNHWVAYRKLEHLTFFSLNKDSWTRVVQLGFSMYSPTCYQRSGARWTWLTDDVDLNTGNLQSDEMVIANVYWQTNDGYWHQTHHSSWSWHQHDYTQYGLWYSNSAYFGDAPGQYFTHVRIVLWMVKSNYTGSAISFSRTVTCSLVAHSTQQTFCQ